MLDFGGCMCIHFSAPKLRFPQVPQDVDLDHLGHAFDLLVRDPRVPVDEGDVVFFV